MGLTVSENNTGSTFTPISEGTHVAVCNMLIDLGEQVNEVYNNKSHKIRIGWELPDEPIETESGTHGRTISKKYTASLNESSNLRKDLAAWRGRDFNQEELEAFDLRNIVGKCCLINVIHKEGNNGKIYANIGSIMALPKGMGKAELSEPAMVFDLDNDPLDKIDTFPTWIAEEIKKSSTYEERAYDEIQPPVVDLSDEDDGDIPF